MSRTSRALLIATSLQLAAGAAESAPSQPDVRVLIDVSGSMKDNDPANLRVPALQLLVGLLPAQARAGIWTFAQSAERQIAAGPVDDTWRQRAGAAADAIHSRGRLTDIELLEHLAIATGGWYERADDEGQLERLFLRMFEKATQPVMETPAEQASPWGVTLAVAGAVNLLLVASSRPYPVRSKR